LNELPWSNRADFDENTISVSFWIGGAIFFLPSFMPLNFWYGSTNFRAVPTNASLNQNRRFVARREHDSPAKSEELHGTKI
jgi:hypothetical protein